MKKLVSILILIGVPYLGHSQNESPRDLKAYFTAIIVSDINTSINWYTSILGFTVLDKVESTERGFKQSNLKRASIHLELIELDAAVNPAASIPNYNSKTRLIGFFKTGFLVSDFDNWLNHLTMKNVNFQGSVVTDDTTEKRMVIIKDPDNNRIQIFEE